MPTCPICRTESFDAYGGRPNARCTGCGALERCRLAWLVLTRLDLLKPGIRMLNLAPEGFMLFHGAPRLGDGYVGTDVDPSLFAKWNKNVVKFDVCTDVDLFPKRSFDVVMHNHVMEHVPCRVEDVLARLQDLLVPGGVQLFSIPIMPNRETTEDLDPSLTPETRRERFGQEDHLRLFGDRDVRDLFARALPAEDEVDVPGLVSLDDLATAGIPADTLTALTAHRVFAWRKPAKGGAGLNAPRDTPVLEIEGTCPICDQATRFVARTAWFRGSLACTTCRNGSVPRERALALVLKRTVPDWREKAVFESSPVNRGISLKLANECRHYTASHFWPDLELGAQIDGVRNENLERMTFNDATFDIVVTLDVFEHVFDPAAMMREIHRILRPGGHYIATFPIRKEKTEAIAARVEVDSDGKIKHLVEPEYHGNPINADGSLVTYDYGYDIHKTLAEWTGFDVEISRFAMASAGILGEYTEVICCTRTDAGAGPV